MKNLNKKQMHMLKCIIGGVIFYIFALALGKLSIPYAGYSSIIVFLIAYVIAGKDVLKKAFRNIKRGQVFDENFLMGIATLGALIIGEYPEAVAVMLFYMVGELFQSIAVNRSRQSIADLMDIRPDYANLKVDGEIKVVDPYEIAVGELIVVKPGEKVPLDGIVIEGNSMLDTVALTGESVPRHAKVGSRVYSGSVNKEGVLTIEVTKEFGESTASKILDLVENAATKKSKSEAFITKFASRYTKFVVIMAILVALIPPLFIEGHPFAVWAYRALIFLVVSCPCALVISIPLSFFGGIGAASKAGILVKGGNYLEALSRVHTVVFDKTGTLTEGVFEVTGMYPHEIEEEKLLELAAYGEIFSSHPIALSIKDAYVKYTGKEKFDEARISDIKESSGHGVGLLLDGKRLLVGNHTLLKDAGIVANEVHTSGTLIYIAYDGVYKGHLVISDRIREDAKKAIADVKTVGVKKTVMLTGDRHTVATEVAGVLGIDDVHGELLPGDKVTWIESYLEDKPANTQVIFVGDGINDAPVLARADIGIAMGGIGSDAAIEAADVVIMHDAPSKIATAIRVAKKTIRIANQNIILALGVKGLVMALTLFGLGTMWEAVFADVGVTFLAILNAMRMMDIKKL